MTAILYVQTCAAEKRRRRKRGTSRSGPAPSSFNTDICEAAAIAACSRTACPSCRSKPNSVASAPFDQSSCNKDYSCLKGFCPSFVTVEGAKPRKGATVDVDTGALDEPSLPEIAGTHNIVITGVGGTGVVTIGALLAMAAHLDGKGAGMMEMAGLAQKGGAVHIHCRIGNRPEDISAIRVAVARRTL